MNNCGENIRVMYPLLQVGKGGSTPTSPLQLNVVKISFLLAKELNALWHSRLPRFGTGCIQNQPHLSYGFEFDGVFYGVAIWSNPVARKLPQDTWLELRRLAIAPDAPRNTASRMLSVMARLIRIEKPKVTTLVSYQDTEVHSGSVYKAAGWSRSALTRGGEWGWEKRPRPKVQSSSKKQRWELRIR